VHKLRHPIVMFVMAVLVVIGIGVGGLAAEGPPKGTYVLGGCRYSDNAVVQTYGPTGSQFVVEFPMKPDIVRRGSLLGMRVNENRKGSNKGCVSLVEMVPLHTATYPFSGNLYEEARQGYWKVVSEQAGPPRLTIWQFSPVRCPALPHYPPCFGVLIATDGRSGWLVEGLAEHPGPVRTFLASFHLVE
jgi:hypothetical protein